MERSCTNEHEAERAFRLACFFIAQGIAPSQITILAAYQAQASLIKGGDLLPVTLGDVWRLGVRLVLFCSPSSESILVLDCGMKAALTSMESSDKLWMETCSCFTYMYGSDVLMYYALFSYTVRVCSYFPHAVIQLYLWIRVDCGRLRCQQLLIRDSSLVILLAGKVKKDLAGFLQKQGVKRELKTVKVQIDPGLVKRGNVVDVTDAARRQERIVTNEQEACNLFHGGKWYVRVQHWMNMFLHRSTFRYLTHVLASYSDDIFQLSLNQKVHVV